MSIGIAIGTHLGYKGAPPSFTPANMSGLALWIDASKEAIADAAAVSTALDWSGNGKHAVQANATKQPTFLTAGLNSKPTFSFDGGDGLVTPTIDHTGTSAVSVFLVALATGAAATQVVVEFGPNVTDNTAWSIFRTAGDVIQWRISGDVGLASFQTTLASLITTAKTVSSVLDKSLAAGEATGWVDGASTGSNPANSNNANAYGNRVVNIGSRNDATAALFVGQISEVMIYNRALTTTERQLIEAYLKAKWGTA